LLYIYPGTEVPHAPETDSNPSPKWANADSRDYYAATRAEFDVSETIMLYAAAGTRDHQSSIVNPYTEIADGEGNTAVYPYQEAYFANTKWSAEAGARTAFNTGAIKHRLVVSGSGIRFDTGWLGTYSDGFMPLPDYTSNLYSPTYPPKPDLSNVASHGVTQLRNKLTGLALVDTLSIRDGRYQATVGLRHQQYDIERLYETDNRFYKESAWSPSIAVLAKMSDTVSLYANYLTGLSQGPFAPVGTANQNQAFPPSKTTQYEIGTKATVGDFFYSVAVFQITQPAGLINPDTNVFSVNGEQRHRGLEATFSGEVGHGARILGGMNYINAKLTRTEGGQLNGQQAPGVPKVTANLGGEWDVGFLRQLTLTARLIYTDKQYLFGENVQSIPAWSRFDAGARYVFTVGVPITLRLNAVNVTGKDNWASAKGSGLTLGAPRSVLLSASVDF
jgi:iron complex outermembrane recepter protein